ncbi:MAG: winged helix-turn-helix domain-containing protein [Euryarchaeota archaeon]|jgi:predicted transcriptional regulator|nr:winged helix-turn-helix domain-containing protein [Euryarchaeota archaeon]
MEGSKRSGSEISEIKEILEHMQRDVKRLIENCNQQQIELLVESSKKDFCNAFREYVRQDIQDNLEKSMVYSCHMREECQSRFTDFLEKNAGLIGQGDVSQDVIVKHQSELLGLAEEAPYKKCDKCFLEVNALFRKQIRLMRALRIYSSEKDQHEDLSCLSEKYMVNNVLGPLSNQQRLQILKSMATKTQTFSQLSELTGLKGGNLLFHLQKLTETDMILQRHERGDYMITEKGYSVLMALSELNCILSRKNIS